MVLKVRCMEDSRYDHPAEKCQPVEGDADWKFTVYWFIVKGYRVFMGTIYFYYIEIFLYLTIGSIQISSMGDLAIQLSSSVRGLFPRDEHCCDKHVAKIPLKYWRMLAFLISFVMVSSALAFAVFGFVFWSQIDTVEFVNPETHGFKSYSKNRQRHSVWIISMLWVLSFLLLGYYIHMRYVLNKYFSGSLQRKKRQINILFLTFLFAYALRAILSPFDLYFKRIVCQMELRWILTGFFRFIFMYIAIVSMLWFHHQSFKVKQQVVMPKQRQSDVIRNSTSMVSIDQEEEDGDYVELDKDEKDLFESEITQRETAVDLHCSGNTQMQSEVTTSFYGLFDELIQTNY